MTDNTNENYGFRGVAKDFLQVILKIECNVLFIMILSLILEIFI